MLILKIMSNEDMPDSDPRKGFRLIADVVNVRFYTDKASDYEKSQMGYESEGRRHFCTIKTADGSVEDWVRYLSADYDEYLNTGGIVTDHWYQEHPGGEGWPSRGKWLAGGYTKSRNDLEVSFAKVYIADSTATDLRGREEHHLLTGNCYVLNDRGKTIESFWARRNHQGEQIEEE